jgi:hypothetical protein
MYVPKPMEILLKAAYKAKKKRNKTIKNRTNVTVTECYMNENM